MIISRTRLACVAVFVALLAFSPAAWAVPSVQDIVNQVNMTDYTNFLGSATVPGILYTQAGYDKCHNAWSGYTGAQWLPVQNNIKNALTDLGYATSLDTGTVWANQWTSVNVTNVVGVKLGTATPDQIYVVGAHYDTVNEMYGQSGGGCPGANDNATGVAAMLEVAKALSSYTFKSTIVFVAFDSEESGEQGSQHYAEAHKNDNIKGMLCIDMIGSPRGTNNEVYVYSEPGNDAFRNVMVSALATYGGITGVKKDNPYEMSDHCSFESQGFKACALMEPNWHDEVGVLNHSANDYINYPGNIDYDYNLKLTKASLGWLAESAEPVSGPAPEPATLSLLALGGLMLARRRRRVAAVARKPSPPPVRRSR
jgi:hypothetical protein